MSWSSGDKITAAKLNAMQAGMGYAYTVYKSGSTVYAKSFVSGYSDYTGTAGTDDAATIQSALDELGSTYLERVAVTGSFTVEQTIEVGAYHVLDLTSATLTAKNSLNDDMIDAQGWHFIIQGGHLEGNEANNASGSCLRIGGATAAQRFFVGDMILHDAKQYGLHMEGTAGNLVGVGTFTNLDIEDTGSTGLYHASYGADHIFQGINIGGCGGNGIYLGGGVNSNTIVNCLIWNNSWTGIAFDGSDANSVTGCRIDQNGYHGISLGEGSNYNLITGNVIYDNSMAAAANYQGIHIYDSAYNSIIGNRCWNVAGDQEFGIDEVNVDSNPEASNYNVFRSNYCTGNTYASNGYSLLGETNSSIFDKTVSSYKSLDLSGAADMVFVHHATVDTYVARATLLYTEASSADAPVGNDVQVGDETSNTYFFQGTSEASKAAWYTKVLTLLNHDLPAGETLTFSLNAGGKAGTGEIKLIVDLAENA